MSRSSHMLLSLLFCFLLAISFLTPRTRSQSTLRSLSLNGTTASVDVPNSTGLNITGPITIEAWIKFNAIDGNSHDIVSRINRNDSTSGGGYSLTVNAVGKLRLDLFQNYNAYTTVIGATVMSTGTWHHVAGVFNGSQMRVYVDGVLDGSLNTTNAPGAGNSLLRIGKGAHPANTPPLYLPSLAFAGLIDEVRVSAAALYSANFTAGLGPGSNVKGLWRFDGQTANDASGSGNHGALQNGATYSTDVSPAAPNSAPSVSLTHPLNNTSIAAGSNIVMDATASDSDGSVTKVDFYQGTTLLGSDTTAPYTFAWTNVAAGNYSLTAKATDDANAAMTSTAIAVTVLAPGGPRSLSLNGTNQYLTASSSTSLNITGPITVEAWIKLNSTGAYQAIVSREAFQQAGTGGGYRLAITDLGKLRLDLFQSHNTYTTAIGTTTVTTGVWHHVAGVFDSSQMRVYVDGTLNGSVSTTNGPASGTGGFYIGRFSYIYNPYYFGGLIDEVRVSAAALYSSNFAPGLGPGSNVRGLWKFDGQTADDFSGNGNHSSLQNSATYSTDVPSTGGGSQRPVPNANGPYSAQLGQAVSFSSSGSFDPDGSVTAYHWNFGDGTTSNSANPSHTYAAPGLYTATLTATDNAGLLASAAAIVTIGNGGNARLDPTNQTGGSGENPLSRNFTWTLPLVTLPGRAGMDLNLSLSYNSLVWTKSGGYISFDHDRGFPSPGFRLGFPVIQPLYYNAEVGKYAFLLIGSDGSRTELRRVGTSDLYEAADSSHLLLNATTMLLRTTDGTQLKYELKGSEYQCTEIKDRNGNYITVNYTSAGRIDTVIDTLERSIKFNYNGNGLLTSITQIWNQGAQNPPTHIWASFEYSNTPIETNFPNMTVSGPSNGVEIKTLSKVTLADRSHYDFSYTSWGQVWKVSSFAADNHLLNYRSYNLPGSPLQTTGPQIDCPRFTERRDWAENWNQNVSGVEQEAITSYSEPLAGNWTMPDGSPAQTGVRVDVTSPDGTVDKIYFLGTAAASGWRRGLPALVETYSGGNWQRKVMTTWTQDDTSVSVSYPLNPRVTETNVYDPAGNRKRVRMTYQQITGTTCQVPRDVYEYGANATTILRSTRTDYHTGSAYTDRRIIGLVTEKRLYEGDVSNGVLKSKVGFFYDNENSASSIEDDDPPPVQHDNEHYGADFVAGRANLSSVKRYNVTNTQFTTTRTKYNTAGAVVSMTDASGHVTQISYADSFSDEVARNTLAYPTKLTDPDGYYSTSKYNYDFGALTYRQTPPPNFNGAPAQQPAGPEQTFTYDTIGRLQRVTNEVNDAYTRYVYPASQIRVDTYTTIQDGLGEAHSFKFTDGAGRVIGTANEHPGSTGGYSGQRFVYDVMARVIKTSNPTETDAVGEPPEWATAGDDGSWVYTQQTYDWKWRPLVATNPDGITTTTASYAGCGCAGGEVVTLTDEGTLDGGVAKRRQQKIYSDILGRTVKTEILNWAGGSVYSTTVNTYNARDQVELITQYAGAEGSATHQETTMAYDGYGRLQSRHVPEQAANTATVWTYNADDTVNTITDARGAVTTFGYIGTNRHLVKQVTHTLTGSPTITTSFAYDAVGNRLSMTDGAGSQDYSYNLLSQLTSEIRTLTGMGSFTINYAYNLSGQLSSLTDPFGAQVGYSHDKIGRLSAITGANFASVSSYASGLQYRAWGGLKSLTYGNSKTLALGYDVNLNVSSYEIPGLMKKSYEYYDDGRLKFTQDQLTTNSKFDRLYKFDHVGRVTSALSGAEARGQGPTDDRPYNETMAYDPMGHLTLRQIRHWDRHDSTGNQTYLNNRRQGWQYDADGRLLSGESTYSYDAAGQISSFGDGDPYMTDQRLDGAGRRVKSTQRSFDPNTNQWTTEAETYYIHSSVIGEVICEVNVLGAKDRGFVHAAGSVIAIQSVAIGQSVTWQHYDASRASQRASDGQGSLAGSKELDPVGANAGLLKPFTWTPPSSPGRLEPYYGVSELNSATHGCVVDGIPMECETALGLAKRGAATVTFVDPVSAAATGRRKPVWVQSDTSYGASDLDNNTVTIFSGAGGQFVWVDEPGGALETFIQRRPQDSDEFTPEQFEKFKDCLNSMFKVYYKEHHYDRNGEAYFTGHSDTRKHWYSFPFKVGTFTVRTDQQSYSSDQLKQKFGPLAGVRFGGGLVVGYTDKRSPFVNAIANDAGVTLKGREFLGLWVYELGNALSIITNHNIEAPPDAEDRYGIAGEPGSAFSDCVFGGRLNSDGSVVRPR